MNGLTAGDRVVVDGHDGEFVRYEWDRSIGERVAVIRDRCDPKAGRCTFGGFTATHALTRIDGTPRITKAARA